MKISDQLKGPKVEQMYCEKLRGRVYIFMY